MKNEAEFEADIRLVQERLESLIAQQESDKGTIEFSTFNVSKSPTWITEYSESELFSSRQLLPAILIEVEKRSNGKIKLVSTSPHTISLATRNKEFLDDNFERDLEPFDAYYVNYSKNSNVPYDKKGLIFYLGEDNEIYHYEKGSIKKDHKSQRDRNGYYALLYKLLEQYENGGENIPFTKLKTSTQKPTFEKLYRLLGSNNNGLWRSIKINNLHPNGKDKIIKVSEADETISFNNKVN